MGSVSGRRLRRGWRLFHLAASRRAGPAPHSPNIFSMAGNYSITVFVSLFMYLSIMTGTPYRDPASSVRGIVPLWTVREYRLA